MLIYSYLHYILSAYCTLISVLFSIHDPHCLGLCLVSVNSLIYVFISICPPPPFLFISSNIFYFTQCRWFNSTLSINMVYVCWKFTDILLDCHVESNLTCLLYSPSSTIHEIELGNLWQSWPHFSINSNHQR